MPDKRTHRGPHPSDEKLFSPEVVAQLRLAVADFSLLLTKGYSDNSALKLVGDRFSLSKRQRLAVMRNACSDQQSNLRKKSEVKIADLTGCDIAIDGYNLLITIEAALSGAVIFMGRDGCFKDLASIHGTYRKVSETIPAVTTIGKFLETTAVSQTLWLLDSPVANSGRLKTLIAELADKNNWNWQIELSPNPDTALAKTLRVVVSSDGIVLNKCRKWVNLAAEIIKTRLPQTWIIDLS
ncbi:MAG: DUF434 domain-containing protein [Planctomycetota bacterium]|jgi:hypothetical protein